MKVYPPRDIRPFVMYCVNGKPRSSLLIESTDSMIFCIFHNVYYFIIKLCVQYIQCLTSGTTLLEDAYDALTAPLTGEFGDI